MRTFKRYDIEQIATVEAENLRQFTWAERHDMSSGTGIYFVRLHNTVVYVGQAGHLKDRVLQHTVIKPLRDEPTLRISYLEMGERWQEVPPETVFLAEQYFLMKYKPSLNKNAACSPYGCYGRYFNNRIGRLIQENYSHQIHRVAELSNIEEEDDLLE